MNFFVKLWILVAGICLPAFVLAHESGHIGGSMMGTMLGMGIMGIFIWTLVVVLLVLAILVCLKYLRNK